MEEKKILIVHPYDKTTTFLQEIINYLSSAFGNIVEVYNVETNSNSHKLCLEKIKAFPNNGLIFFLGHGRSDALYGSKGDHFYPDVSFEEVSMAPDLFFFNESFITKSNIDVFSSKKVFCLACNSNSKIAEFALDKGVSVYLGFGNIPTSVEEFKWDGGITASSELVASMKSELNYIIKRSIEISISKSFSFHQLYNIMQFIINQRISDILVNQKSFDERHILADYLYYLKKDIKIFGNKNYPVIS